MERTISQYAPYLYAALRIVAGLLFAMHGSQKLFGIPGSGDPVPLFSLMGFAGVVELGGGLLIALGLFTRVAAFLSSGQMAVAYFMAHLPQGHVPLLNKGELSLIYCFLFLYIAAQGAGIWSLDTGFRKRT
ncbi:DoxX family protein [Spirosoma sp.]|uniref:DoxX family protein n=1 Tax=Spirosoma sp. TaxID=1899569 RepID=UPI003B3B4B20